MVSTGFTGHPIPAPDPTSLGVSSAARLLIRGPRGSGVRSPLGTSSNLWIDERICLSSESASTHYEARGRVAGGGAKTRDPYWPAGHLSCARLAMRQRHWVQSGFGFYPVGRIRLQFVIEHLFFICGAFWSSSGAELRFSL